MIDWAHLNGVDWVIISVLAVSTLLSLWRGFTREALSLAGWVAALVIALYFFLVLVSDRNGLSFYSYDAICSLLQMAS